MKKCSKCKRDLPADKFHFYSASNTKDRLRPACRECEGHKFSEPKPVIPEGYLMCKKCGRTLPATPKYFGKDPECKCGVVSPCKECRGHKFITMEVMPVIDGKRVCNICRRNLPYTKEYFYGGGTGRLRSDCKECERKISKIRYDKNAQHRRNYAREWYQEHYADDEKRKEASRTKAKAYIAANRHTQKYKVSRVMRSQRRRAREKDLPSTLIPQQWEECKKYFNYVCAYCEQDKPLTQDHFIPLSKGGEYSANNIIPACMNCNSNKSSRLLSDWYPKQPFYSKQRESKILDYLGYSQGVQQLSLM